MLLDPFEEQLDLPTTSIEFGDCEGRQREVVGEKNQGFVGRGILEPNASQRSLEAFVRIEACEDDGLIADQPRGTVDGMRVPSLRVEIRFAAGDKEAAGLVKAVQALEVEEPPIHHVERARLGHQLIEDVDLVHLAVADVDEGRDVAAQIEQGVQLDRRFGRTEWCPRKHRQAQIDRRRIQRVDRLLQIDTKGFVDIEWPRDADEALREIGVDAPVAHHIRERIACDRRANPEVVQLRALGAQTRLDVAQALPKGQLRERHAQKLIQTGERLNLAFPAIPRHTSTKRRQRKVLHQLRKNQFAVVHQSPLQSRASQGYRTGVRSSNRDQGQSRFTRS